MPTFHRAFNLQYVLGTLYILTLNVQVVKPYLSKTTETAGHIFTATSMYSFGAANV